MSKLKLPVFIKKPDFKNRKTVAITALAIIAVVAAGWFVFVKNGKLGDNGKVYAQAAGHKVYKKEVDNLIGKNKNVTEHQAAEVLADKYLTEAIAKEQGVTVSDKDIQAQYGKGTLKQKTTDKYSYQNKVNQVYFAKLQAHNSGIYKGKMLVANFSRHIQAYPTLPEDKMHDPLLGNANAIAKDKKYAQGLITGLYDQVVSGKITFDQAIRMENSDSKIGRKAYPSLEHSGSFDTKSMLNGVLKADSVRQKINSIKAGETTKPFIVKVSNSIDNPKSMVESYFLVIKMDETSGNYTGTNFGQYLEQAKQKLGYGVYV